MFLLRTQVAVLSPIRKKTWVLYGRKREKTTKLKLKFFFRSILCNRPQTRTKRRKKIVVYIEVQRLNVDAFLHKLGSSASCTAPNYEYLIIFFCASITLSLSLTQLEFEQRFSIWIVAENCFTKNFRCIRKEKNGKKERKERSVIKNSVAAHIAMWIFNIICHIIVIMHI